MSVEMQQTKDLAAYLLVRFPNLLLPLNPQCLPSLKLPGKKIDTLVFDIYM